MALGFGAGMLAGWAAGWWIGRLWRDSAKPKAFKSHEASLALLGLLIAFTFSMALGKHEQQKTMVIADSNAIGDFNTCAGMIKGPVRAKLQSLLRQYTQLHIGLSGRWRDKAAFGGDVGKNSTNAGGNDRPRSCRGE